MQGKSYTINNDEAILPEISDVSFKKYDINKKRLQIQGHRGGFQPENTMESFRQAIESNLDAIEFDVWMTKDEQLVILHGGDDGELNHHFKLPQIEYIFDKTYDELQVYDVGKGQKVPKLQTVLEFINKRLVCNIEVKAPHQDQVKVNYDFKKAISKVHDLILNLQLQNHCMVSSFDAGVLEELESLNKVHNTSVKIIYLYNFYEYEELPEESVYTKRGSGINISSTKVNSEIIQNCHSRGKLVGVWINKEAFTENDAFYQRMIEIGVDFICTDYPLQANSIRAESERINRESINALRQQFQQDIEKDKHNKTNADLMSSSETNFTDQENVDSLKFAFGSDSMSKQGNDINEPLQKFSLFKNIENSFDQVPIQIHQ